MEPKIRFKGFEGEWKEYSLGELGSIYSGIGFPECEQGGRSGIPFYKVSDMNNQGNESIMLSSNNYVSDNQIQRNHWKICSETPAIFFAKVGAAVMLNRKRIVLEPCLCDNNTMMFSLSKDKWSTNFALPLFNNVDFPSLAQVGSLPSFNGSQVKEIKVKLPKFEEQEVVGKYFTTLDSQISASTSRLASLKQMKAASLQAMFPQEGETVPKIRFKGFEGEWKKVKLGDIAKFTKGQGYSKSDLKETGQPIILYGRMYTKYQFVIDEVDTFANLKDASILSEGDEIIMPASGETPEDIACASAVLAKDIILGGDLNIMHFDLTKISTPYIALVITYSKTHHDLSKCAQGKSVVHLHNGAISKAIISLPSLAEQQAIASYFTSLDRQISLQSQRLEKLKQIKSACLDKMFV